MAKRLTIFDEILATATVRSQPRLWKITLFGRQAEAVRQRARERGITEVQAFAELVQEEKKP